LIRLAYGKQIKYFVYYYINMWSLIQNKYHIVRIGDFATNGNTKILYSGVSIIMCISDYISRNSFDCLSIFVGSTIIWSFIELLLHVSRTRVIKPMYITTPYTSNYQLSQPVGIMLQGLQEGGLVTTLGLYFGDRIFEIKTFVLVHLFILFIIRTILTRPNTTRIASKRQVNTPSSLICIGTVTVYDVYMLYHNPEHIYRQLSMFFIMTYICSIWTYFAWYRGFRTIEVHIKKRKNYITISSINSDTTLEDYHIKPVTIYDTFFILAYDIFFEIGIAYMLFYNLFIIQPNHV